MIVVAVGLVVVAVAVVGVTASLSSATAAAQNALVKSFHEPPTDSSIASHSEFFGCFSLCPVHKAVQPTHALPYSVLYSAFGLVLEGYENSVNNIGHIL